MLALDERWYVQQASRAWRNSAFPELRLFAGHFPSPLFRIFKDNGYETTTMYESYHFGETKGPFVDHYFIPGAPQLCRLLDERFHGVSFWGYCALVGRHHPGRAEITGAARYETYRRMINHLVYDVRSRSRKRPQFAMAHVYAPGHTSRSYHHDDEHYFRGFRWHYLRGSNDAAFFLNELLLHLDEHDPEAILLVYGDHGPLLSRNVRFADAPNFVVQDHFGVLGGVYPRDACAEWFDRAQERLGYLTLLDAVHTVLRCLSGGESALRDTPKMHSVVGEWHRLVPDGHLKPYSEFLYE